MSECDTLWYLYISQDLHRIPAKNTSLMLNVRWSALHLDYFTTYLVVTNAWSTFFHAMFYCLSENTCVSGSKLLYRNTYIFITLTTTIFGLPFIFIWTHGLIPVELCDLDIAFILHWCLQSILYLEVSK
jgi:hypothetical protein